MGRKSAKPVPTFREIVSLRYKKDTIMNGFATAVVLLMPLLVMSIVQLLIEMKVGRLEELEPYKNMVSQIVINIEMFVVMAILYQMHKRLRTHAQRDRMWRQSLIQFANRMGADTYELEEIDRKIRAREHFPLTPVIMLLMGLMFLFCVYLFVYYAPYWLTVEGSDEFLSNTMYIGIILCLAQLIIIFYNVLTYAYKHEKRQCEFTLELSKRLGEVGVTTCSAISAGGASVIRPIISFVFIAALSLPDRLAAGFSGASASRGHSCPKAAAPSRFPEACGRGNSA